MPTKQEAKKKNFCAVLMQRLLRALADVRPLVRAGGCAVRPCAGPSCAAAGTGNGATAIVRGLLELFLLSFLLTPVFSEAVPFVADNHLHRIFGHARLPFEACQSEAPINGRLAGIGPHAQACDGLCLLTRKVMGLQKTHTHTSPLHSRVVHPRARSSRNAAAAIAPHRTALPSLVCHCDA